MKFNLTRLAFILIVFVGLSLQQQQADENEKIIADSQANAADVDMKAADQIDQPSPVLGDNPQIEAAAEATSDVNPPPPDESKVDAASDDSKVDVASDDSKVVDAENNGEKTIESDASNESINNNNENNGETKEEVKTEVEVKADEHSEAKVDDSAESVVGDTAAASADVKEEDKTGEIETAENVEEKLKKPEAIKADVVLADEDPVLENTNNDDSSDNNNNVEVVVSNDENNQQDDTNENGQPDKVIISDNKVGGDSSSVDTSNSIQESTNQLRKDTIKAQDSDDETQAKKEQINASIDEEKTSKKQTAGLNLLYILIPIVCGSVLVLIVIAFILRAKTNLFRRGSNIDISSGASPARAAIYKAVPQSEQNAPHIP